MCPEADPDALKQSFFDSHTPAEKPGQISTDRGILLFADHHGRPIVIITAGNMRRTARARLASPEEASKKADIASISATVHSRLCYNDFETQLYYNRAVRSLMPHLVDELIRPPRLHYLSIDPEKTWPRLQGHTTPPAGNALVCSGPVGTSAAANELIDAILYAYGLCRRHDLAQDPEKARSCPYLQMELCPAPCVGNISMQHYKESVRQALPVVKGGLETLKNRLDKLMTECSANLQFEKAQQIKERINSLERKRRGEYRWLNDLSKLRILHIDKHARVTNPKDKRKKLDTFQYYIITAHSVTEGHNFLPDDIEKVVDEIQKKAANGLKEDNPNEGLETAGYFLFRKEPPGLWLDISDGKSLPAIEKIKEKMCKKFDRTIFQQPNPLEKETGRPGA